MLIPRTLPRPRHRNLWDEPGPGNLCLTTSLVSLPQSNLREPLSQLVHPFPTSSQALSGGANLGCPPLELPPAILTQPCGLNHRRPSTGCQARLRGNDCLVSALGSHPTPISALGPQPWAEDADQRILWGGPADSLTPAPSWDSELPALGLIFT